MCFPVSYAGFFAKSQIMFFLPSSFRFCPPLKNDGTRELRFLGSKFLPVILERSEESRQRMRVLNAFCDSPLCTPTAPFTSSMTAGEFFSLHKTPKIEHV